MADQPPPANNPVTPAFDGIWSFNAPTDAGKTPTEIINDVVTQSHKTITDAEDKYQNAIKDPAATPEQKTAALDALAGTLKAEETRMNGIGETTQKTIDKLKADIGNNPPTEAQQKQLQGLTDFQKDFTDRTKTIAADDAAYLQKERDALAHPADPKNDDKNKPASTGIPILDMIIALITAITTGDFAKAFGAQQDEVPKTHEDAMKEYKQSVEKLVANDPDYAHLATKDKQQLVEGMVTQAEDKFKASNGKPEATPEQIHNAAQENFKEAHEFQNLSNIAKSATPEALKPITDRFVKTIKHDTAAIEQAQKQHVNPEEIQKLTEKRTHDENNKSHFVETAESRAQAAANQLKEKGLVLHLGNGQEVTVKEAHGAASNAPSGQGQGQGAGGPGVGG